MGYRIMCGELLRMMPNKSGNWSQPIFGWCFFVVQWNLTCRPDSADTLMINHIELGDDCLLIEEQGHKGDQTGENRYKKAVFANPFDPYTCPVLAIGTVY
jgi:hypothetical protein